MSNIFDDYLDTSFGERKQADFKFEQFAINYRRFFPEEKSSRILDIGVGRGEMMECFKRWGYNNYLGVDISSSVIEFCKSLNYNCELIEDTASWLNDKKNSFDVVTLIDVLEHIPKSHTIEFLRSIYDSLKDNGMLIIQVPNLQSPEGYLIRYDDFTHEVGFTEHSLRQVLLSSGFKEISFYGFEGYLLDNWKKHIGKFLRGIYWKYVRFIRMITNNLTPSILNPVFFAVVKK